MTLAAAILFAEMSSAEAITHLLNAPTSCGRDVYEEARRVVARDAAAGKPLQQFVLGVTTGDKALAARNLAASRGKIRALAETKGNTLAWYLLSVEKNDFAALEKAAAGGNVQALNALGSIVVAEALARKGIASDELGAAMRRAYDCFSRAARQKDPNGLVNLGTCHLRGLGCRKDPRLAVRCYRAAATLGHPEAMDNLSASYQLGQGVEKDDALSLRWAMRARALRGDKAAERWLRSQGEK